MIFGPGWAMLLSVVQVVIFGRASLYKGDSVQFLLNYGSR